MLKSPLSSLTRPTLLISKSKCVNNLRRMASKAKKNGVHFRPHFKTHQSAMVGEWCRRIGISAITVSSVSMAKYFSAHGWKDITIAFSVNVREILDIVELSEEVHLNLLVESTGTVDFLENHLKTPLSVFVKIDTGNGRTGIVADDFGELDVLMNKLQSAKQLKFKGFLAHSGHTYACRKIEHVADIFQSGNEKLQAIRNRYISQYPDLLISVGDTPSCSLLDDFSGVDEIRPGNFIFYDVMQQNIGSCDYDDISVAVACPVVAKHESRNEIIIYGGAVHFSSDRLVLDAGKTIFGRPVKLRENDWGMPLEGGFVRSLSQEHGIIRLSPDDFQDVHIGDLIGVLPVHSCLTASLLQGEVVVVK